MGKSVEELRRILERMQKDLDRPGAAGPAVKEPVAEPMRLDKPRVEPELPKIQERPASAVVHPSRVAAEIRKFKELPEEPETFDRNVLWEVWKNPRALLWGATVTAILGVILRNIWVLGSGFLGLLVYALFWHSGDGNLNLEELEDLSQRVAILERRVNASRTIPASGSGGISRQTAEEIEELRVMVKSIYRALQGPTTAPEPTRRRDEEGDE